MVNTTAEGRIKYVNTHKGGALNLPIGVLKASSKEQVFILDFEGWVGVWWGTVMKRAGDRISWVLVLGQKHAHGLREMLAWVPASSAIPFPQFKDTLPTGCGLDQWFLVWPVDPWASLRHLPPGHQRVHNYFHYSFKSLSALFSREWGFPEAIWGAEVTREPASLLSSWQRYANRKHKHHFSHWLTFWKRQLMFIF